MRSTTILKGPKEIVFEKLITCNYIPLFCGRKPPFKSITMIVGNYARCKTVISHATLRPFITIFCGIPPIKEFRFIDICFTCKIISY